MDLLQARLLKSSCSLIYGAQFDVVQTGAILEAVFKAAVAGTDVAIKLGPHVLREMLDRQHDQVAGIQAFTSSLKVGGLAFSKNCSLGPPFGNTLS